MNDFDEKIPTPLCEIMGRNESDKGHKFIQDSWHNYTTFYYFLFKDIRYNQLRLFELGLGTNNTNIPSNMGINGRPGASLYGFNEFFVNSKIYGADIDKNILFNTDTIKTFYCDQTDPDVIANMWNEPSLEGQFDIIIDDGLHTFDANMCFLENSIHKLATNGYYIIEDISTSDLLKWEDQIRNGLYAHKFTFKLLIIPSKRNIWDNNLLVITRQSI